MQVLSHDLGQVSETFLHSAAIIQVSSTQHILVSFYVHRGWDLIYFIFLNLQITLNISRHYVHYSTTVCKREEILLCFTLTSLYQYVIYIMVRLMRKVCEHKNKHKVVKLLIQDY